jgi:ribosome maturation factor RimP
VSEHTMVSRVSDLIVPILADLGLSLYDLDFGAGLLKVTVDRAGGVDLDTLALATRLINRELDHTDPVPGKYTLEVSSPGIERSLRRPEHFAAVIGATVNVRLRDVTNEARRFQGTLMEANDTAITVHVDGDPRTPRTVGYDHIDRARTVFVWGAAPKGRPRKAAPPSPNQEVSAS